MVTRIGTVALGARPRIVAAGSEGDLEALTRADGADIVEVRADLFEAPTPERLVGALERVRQGGRPVILTVRREQEGGGPLTLDARRELYEAGLAHADAIDVEIASTGLLAALGPAARAAGRTLILSAHDFASTPPAAALRRTIDRARAAEADVVKIATMTRSLDDLRTLLEVTIGAVDEGIVAVGMGPQGPLSRLVLPAAGSLLTYASVGQPTAPGQLPLSELARLMRDLYV
jgi:3-dehydroquinate dehydratase-1